MTKTPEQIALIALAELDETPTGDPVAQVRAIVAETYAQIRNTRDFTKIRQLTRRNAIASLAEMDIEDAHECAELEALYALPDATREG